MTAISAALAPARLALCRKLRPYVAVLIDLLLAEEEMMTSPLTQHYLYVIDELHAQAGADKPCPTTHRIPARGVPTVTLISIPLCPPISAFILWRLRDRQVLLLAPGP